MANTGWQTHWHKHPGVRSGDQLSLGERAADRMRNSMGSWPFVFGFFGGHDHLGDPRGVLPRRHARSDFPPQFTTTCELGGPCPSRSLPIRRIDANARIAKVVPIGYGALAT